MNVVNNNYSQLMHNTSGYKHFCWVCEWEATLLGQYSSSQIGVTHCVSTSLTFIPSHRAEIK